MGWRGGLLPLRRLQSERYARIQRAFFGAHPDGLATTPYFSMFLQSEPHFLSGVVIQKGVWEPQTTRLFDGLLTPSTLVVDVGANIGWFSLLGARRAKRVFAFEPEVLTGSRRLISEARVKHVIMEWNPSAWTSNLGLLEPFDAFRVDGLPFVPGSGRVPEMNVHLVKR